MRGLIDPGVRVELRLPVATYRQRYLQNGCAGLCGFIDVGAQAAYGCAPVAEDTMAMASDDLGHLAASPENGVVGTDPRCGPTTPTVPRAGRRLRPAAVPGR